MRGITYRGLRLPSGAKSLKIGDMKKVTNGLGTLRLNGETTVVRMMGTTACRVEESDSPQKVRIVMIGKFPGGCEMDLTLSAEDAVQFASMIYGLAREAIIKNNNQRAVEGGLAVAA